MNLLVSSKSWPLFSFVFCAVLLPNAAGGLYAQSIFWADSGTDTIRSSTVDKTEQATVIPGDSMSALAPLGGGVAVDAALGKVYWTDFGSDIIGVADIDGNNAQVLIDLREALGVSNAIPRGMTLDPNSQNIYWVETSAGKIYRANSDGTNIQLLVSALGAPRDVALDLEGGRMYWTENGGAMISSANLDGSSVTRNLLPTLANPVELALDVANGHIYWTASSSIQRGNLDGSGTPITVLQDPLVPTGLAIDFTNQHIYWATNQGTPNEWIRRANLDGSEIDDKFLDAGTGFVTLTIVPSLGNADSDGDGVPDDEDAFPLDPAEQSDNDLDGIGDNADVDDDNDGLLDLEEDANGNGIVDANETDPNIADTDGDGEEDGVDSFPLDANVSSLEEFAILIRDIVLNPALIQDSDLKRAKLRRPLQNKLTALIDTLRAAEVALTLDERDDYLLAAADKLSGDLIGKTDGDHGGKRNNDWLVTSGSRQLLYGELNTLLESILNEL